MNDLDEEWAAKLRALKFEAHNEAWLEACASGSNVQQVRDVYNLVYVHLVYNLLG